MLHHLLVLLALMLPCVAPRRVAWVPVAFRFELAVAASADEYWLPGLSKVACGPRNNASGRLSPSEWVGIHLQAHSLQPVFERLIVRHRKRGKHVSIRANKPVQVCFECVPEPVGDLGAILICHIGSRFLTKLVLADAVREVDVH